MNKFIKIEKNEFDFDKERQKIIDNLNLLKKLPVEEQTLYKKWSECRFYQNKYDSSVLSKKYIWTPTDIFNINLTTNEILNLKPKIHIVKNDFENNLWTDLRIFCHTMEYEVTPGRFVKLLISDENTNKILGVVSLSSDISILPARDNDIGWNHEQKFNIGKLKNTSVASCIMSTQPFGYNFLGGKLIASLLSTEYIRSLWKKLYDDVLIGITTTSLYGSHSMYNNIPYWKKMGTSKGRVFIKPDNEYYEKWHHWVRDNKKEEYLKITTKDTDSNGPPTSVKQRIISLIFKELKIKFKDYEHGFSRGVYFLPMYDNYREFLTNKISDTELKLKKKLDSDLDGVLKWWKNKAINRYIKLYHENRLKPEILYYNKLPYMEWELVKEKYLNEVGR